MKNITSVKIMLLGSGELGKEFVIAAQRLGIYTIAVDRYDHAPAMQVSDEKAVIDMQDSHALNMLVNRVKPDYIVPEVEAIATEELLKLENEDYCVIPSANAVQLTMDREGIRKLAYDLGLKTSDYQFANNYEAFMQAVDMIGLPCVVKPLMSSSGKGQSVLREIKDLGDVWQYAQENARGYSNKVIVETLIEFDVEITLLTVSHQAGISFCDPIGHIQEDGDYRLSWQPHSLSDDVLNKAQHIAQTIVRKLGGHGVFGVELFIKDNEVYFNEVSPRPHDTGMVTLISQNINEFELHLRAILNLPIGEIETLHPSASAAILLEGDANAPSYAGIDQALSIPQTDIRIFGKPDIHGKRRMGVALAYDKDIKQAKQNAQLAANKINLTTQ
ncbi:formate-dependent phosphoribosylglycinamide formyltransferase [Thiotrichales bacterium 19S9-12]|nr:formate-dependent phosphoribosylglycinamide formyltransferase [Thiotrichales bacterium 19S9-11]MCF6811827.1 formate-dependent phosphoribosylglycinamide formyltransferase [Thiotrichales bacterium 19S9-12]